MAGHASYLNVTLSAGVDETLQEASDAAVPSASLLPPGDHVGFGCRSTPAGTAVGYLTTAVPSPGLDPDGSTDARLSPFDTAVDTGSAFDPGSGPGAADSPLAVDPDGRSSGAH